jgi:predicted permease
VPGIRAASAITFAPLAGAGSATSFWPADRPIPQAGQFPVADLRWVHRDYHRALGIPLMEGRTFDETDGEGAPMRVVINESGARLLWPGESAVGKRVALEWDDTIRSEVIGVVRDVLFNGPETERRTMLYWDHRQFRAFSQMTLVVRTDGDPAAVAPGIRAAVRQLDANLPVFNVRAMDELYGKALARPRFATLSLGLFAAVALVLAALGIYGVISHATQQREREFGIRLALGATRGDVIRLVMRQGVRLTALAILFGVAGALLLNRSLQGLVFQVSTSDPLTFGSVIVILAAIALTACWLPAWRASSIPPVEAIRRER